MCCDVEQILKGIMFSDEWKRWSRLRVAVVRSEQLVTKAGDILGTKRKVNIRHWKPTKQRLVMTEKTSCVL
jgi:hypothetical protein